MKILGKAFLAAMLVIGSTGAYAETLYKFKCYALLEDNNFAVIDVETKQKALVQAQKAAIAEGHQYPGAERQQVAQVMECVSRTSDFADEKARELDKLKLR